MNLNYSVAWIEDQPHNVSAIKYRVEEYLRDRGFSPIIDWYESDALIDELLADDNLLGKYDLFLVDWNLTNKQNGDDVSGKIRNSVYTEIVFYSASPANELRRQIHTKQIDGVYCAQRNDLYESSTNVIETTIKKVIDLENMRGIVSAAVGHNDHSFRQGIVKLAGLMGEDAIKSYVIQKLQDSHDSRTRKLKKIGQMSLSDLLHDHRILDSNTLHLVFSTHIGQWLNGRAQEHLEQLAIYPTEIIQVRNSLAHAVAIEQNGKKILMIQGQNEVMDDQFFTAVRQKLLIHSGNLYALIDLLV